MVKEQKPLVFALDALSKSGTISRTLSAITSKSKSLSLEDIAEITGMSTGNIRSHGVPPLIRAQIIERDKTPEGVVFRFTSRWLTFLREKYALAHPT